jgi:hypothetical protein
MASLLLEPLFVTEREYCRWSIFLCTYHKKKIMSEDGRLSILTHWSNPKEERPKSWIQAGGRSKSISISLHEPHGDTPSF